MTARIAAPFLLIASLVSASISTAVVDCVDHGRSLRLVATRAGAGAVDDMSRMGPYVLLGVADVGLTVYDLTNPEIPWFIVEHVLGAGQWRVAGSGSTAVMARADDISLLCLDMGAPSSPREAGSLTLPGWTVDMVGGASHIYILCDTDIGGAARMLITVDVTNPDAPLITDSQTVSDQTAALDLRDQTLALAGPLSPNLRIFNLSAPAVPTSVDTWHGGGLVRDVALSADRAWLAGNGVLVSIDITGDAQLALSHYDPGAWTEVAIEGTRLHLLGDSTDDAIGYEVFDIAFGTFDLIGSSAMTGGDVEADGSWSYLAREEEGFAVLALDDPRPVAPAGVVVPETIHDDVMAVFTDGDLAGALLDTRTAGGSPTGRLWLLDVSDPEAPVRLAGLDIQYEPRGLALGGDLAAVISYSSGQNRGKLALVDISDPAAPVLGSIVNLGGDPRALFVRGNYVQVFVEGTNVLGVGDHTQLVYAADPADPQVALFQPLPEAPRCIGVDGNAVVMSMDGILDYYIYDASMVPVLVDTWNTSVSATSLALDGTRLIIGGDGYVLTGDLEVPGQLDLHTSVALPGLCSSLLLDGDMLYASAGDLIAIDVSMLEAPRWAGMVGPGAGGGVATTSAVLVAGAGPRGVELLCNHCEGGVGNDDPPPSDEGLQIPQRSSLSAPRPNPFNPSVRVAFELARPGRALVTVHDVAGALVATLSEGVLSVGHHEVDWHGCGDEGREMPAGLYLVRLSTEDGADTRKVSLIR